MNKEYYLVDGKVIVSDEEGTLREEKNYDIINEVLEQENVVEQIEKKIKIMESVNIKPIKGEFVKSLKRMTVTILVGWGLILLFLKLGGTPMVSTTIIGTVSAPIMLASVATVAAFISSGMVGLKQYLDNKEIKKHQNGVKKALDYLTEQLSKEQEKLDELNNKKQVVESKKNDSQIMRLHCSTALKDIDNYALVNYNVGYDFDKYYKSYQNGKLQSLLQREDDINNIYRYIDVIETEQKRLSLTKKNK